MSSYSLRLTDLQRGRLEELLFRDESESAALAICGRSSVPDPWTSGVDERFIIRELIEVPPEAYLEKSPVEFTWSTTPFYKALKTAEKKDFAVAVFHSHPPMSPGFSEKDDIADRGTLQDSL